ncbi:hypothetical protein FJZ53_07075 [Candidatus Woesearchaeota archaeon]|nr:hypothetical protein [Candidatus Woesearchaeota archaeon]
MRIPEVFVPKDTNLEEKIGDLIDYTPKKGPHIDELDFLKHGRTKKEKKEFLKLFAKHLPCLVEEAKEKMKQTRTAFLYLDDTQNGQVYGVCRTILHLETNGSLHFLYSVSGSTYEANLDNKGPYSENGYSPLYDFLHTYPDKDTPYDFYGETFLDSCFKSGKEMYERIHEFLEG